MSEKIYRFWSRSQQVVRVMDKGRVVTVTFTTPHMGVSRYTTSNAGIAQQIRDTYIFRRGEIQEDVVEEEPEKKEVHDPKPRLAHVDKPMDSWMDMGMGKTGKPKMESKQSAMNAVIGGDGVDDKEYRRAEAQRKQKAVQMEFFDTGLNDKEVDENDGEEFSVGADNAGCVDDMKLKLEDVQNLMDAKEYLKEVMGVPADKIRLKADMQAYCQAEGIVFPNYEF